MNDTWRFPKAFSELCGLCWDSMQKDKKIILVCTNKTSGIDINIDIYMCVGVWMVVILANDKYHPQRFDKVSSRHSHHNCATLHTWSKAMKSSDIPTSTLWTIFDLIEEPSSTTNVCTHSGVQGPPVHRSAHEINERVKVMNSNPSAYCQLL